MTIVKRLVKGSALTHAELDGNFDDLDGRQDLGDGSTAAAGALKVADGAGSYNWLRHEGFGQWADTAVTAVAGQSFATGVTQTWTNDGLRTNIQKSPEDLVNPLFDTAANKIRPIVLFDTYTFRFGMTVEGYAGATPFIHFQLNIGGAIGGIYTNTIQLIKGGALQAIGFSIPAFAGATFIANGGELLVEYTGTGSVDIYNKDVFIRRETKNYV